MAEIMALPFGLITAVSYLIVLSDRTVLIDPTAPPKRLPSGLPPVRTILATHGHFDHIDQADAWRDQTGADLAIHASDGDCLTDPARNLSSWIGQPQQFRPAGRLLTDGDVLHLDEEHQMEVWHTPGHTSGSCCLLLRNAGRAQALFSGDTLFAGSIGRTDLGGDDAAMKRSLQRLAAWASDHHLTEKDDLVVYPGHGEATGLWHECLHNAFLTGL